MAPDSQNAGPEMRFAGASLTIDLEALKANYAALAQVCAPAVTAGVVKADAYGLGIDRVAPALSDAGCMRFFVALPEEGAAVRKAVPDATIYVLNGLFSEESGSLYLQDRLIPVLNSPVDLRLWETFCGVSGVRLPCAINVDTGMNRLGMTVEEALAFAEENALTQAIDPVLVMSHLACADEPAHPMNAQQLHSFRTMTDGIAHRRSLAATGGILLGPEYHFDLVRPGIGLYGGRPFDDATPVVALSAPIVQTRIVRPFETVGYGNTWTANVESCIATISAGYADGLIRALGPNGRVWAGDVPCPIVGRVSMDLITVDVTHLEDLPETLEILGPHQSVDDLADAAGTIGYEILTSLGHRYARHYVGAA